MTARVDDFEALRPHLLAVAYRLTGIFADLLPRVTAMTVRDGLVCAIWDVANPEKFSGSPLRGAARLELP